MWPLSGDIDYRDHLFITCRVRSMVWHRLCVWLGWELVLLSSLIDLFLVFDAFSVGKQCRMTIFLLSMRLWSFWKARNDLLFSGKLFSVDQLVGTIIHHSRK